MRSNLLKWLLFVGLVLVSVATFLWVPMVQRPAWDQATQSMKPVAWPLFRIMIFHVPVAWVAALAFLTSTIYSVQTLRTRDPLADIKAASAAELGLIFGILATITGSIWAKFEWGSYWNWDPRETSILILLLIYAAYFALRSALPESESRARISAVYAIAAFVTVPFLVFIVPRVVDSLHPAPIVDQRGKMQMDKELLVVFMGSLVCFTGLYFWILDLKVALAELRERW